MILMTGFEPFLDHPHNPSWELAQELSQVFTQVRSLLLPVQFQKSFEVLKTHIEENCPTWLIMLGLANDRKSICLERIALNWIESSHPDNAGNRFYQPQPIIPGAPSAIIQYPNQIIDRLFEKLPTDLMVSFSAGGYVCNDLYFRTLHHFEGLRERIVFIHVPPFLNMQKERQLQTLTFLIDRLLYLTK